MSRLGHGKEGSEHCLLSVEGKLADGLEVFLDFLA